MAPFKLKEDEFGRDMYLGLNLIVNELNSIGLKKLSDANIVSKIISMIPHDKYASIITILHNMEDLSSMTSMLIISKLVAFEMSWKMGQEEATSSSKSITLACDSKETSSSSSSDDKDEEEDDDEGDDQDFTSSSNDEVVIQLIQWVKSMLHKMRTKGVAITIKVIIVDGY